MRRRGGQTGGDGEANVERIEPSFGSARGEGSGQRRARGISARDDASDDVLLSAPSPRRAAAMRENESAGRAEQREPARESGRDRARDASPAPREAARRRASNMAPRRVAGAAVKPRRLPAIDVRWLWLPVVALLAVACYFAYEPLQKLLERPFKSVVVESDFHFVSKARATELISDEIDNNFLRLDLMRLKEVLMADPWVESVSLQRRWPDTLVVKIAEQKPIARWDDGFLNQRGQIIRVAQNDVLQGLPWLQGNEADAVEILQQYQDLSQLLRSRGLDVVALKCDNKKSWRLTLKNDVEIAIGRTKVMEKIRRFVTVYDTHLNSVWMDVAAIDVRYSNGLAVRWVEGSESAKRYLRGAAASVGSNPAQPRLY